MPWYGLFVRNVATTSAEEPAPYVPGPATFASATVIWPPPTGTAGVPPYPANVQPAGTFVPLNSSPTLGLRITSPSAIWDT